MNIQINVKTTLSNLSMKITTCGLLALLMSSNIWAANPVWLQGKTDEQHAITVYRSASCGCCKGWISHLKDHNFLVKDVVVDDVNKFKLQFNVSQQAASCHTATVNGVTIEGHVPAQDIKKLLSEDNNIRLLTVPAMPSGTPGMDMPGAPKSAFKVYAITEDNQAAVYNSYSDY
ncbi:MAG: hypothetical protein ACI8XC_002304 [Gammaproteobacteria bacterium]|jgi:hypothetical protein